MLEPRSMSVLNLFVFFSSAFHAPSSSSSLGPVLFPRPPVKSMYTPTEIFYELLLLFCW